MYAGPVLRRTNSTNIVLWFATDQAIDCQLELQPIDNHKQTVDAQLLKDALTSFKAGEQLWIHLLDLRFDKHNELPSNCWIGYDLKLKTADSDWLGFDHWAPDLVYDNQVTPGFVIRQQIASVLHGSCRKPHHPSFDGLVSADQWLQTQSLDQWPSVLLMTGDQIYADDVSATTLHAIHQLLAELQLPDEDLPDSTISSSRQLHAESPYYNRRTELLPKSTQTKEVIETLFKGSKKPIFTSDDADNHLITLGEVLAMYLLVWSPEAWRNLTLKQLDPDSETGEIKASNETNDTQDTNHLENLQEFIHGLSQVRRIMAHLPSAMIFDDHDISDDWNLTAAWEKTAYENDFSRRMIGNAIIGYTLCQGLGNNPENFVELHQAIQESIASPGTQVHNETIQTLLKFNRWNYQWDYFPQILVLDTRTQRWRSEVSPRRPSGLMDWEALTNLQHKLISYDAVIMVSPSPVFGVKIIETVQRIFTWFGRPLLVDAENWMAHPGSAYTLLNLFRHRQTPAKFTILSGDVHYSFVYRVKVRWSRNTSKIWQITSSGIKNEFPKSLLDLFDRMNRWLYAPYSPLNLFTKRRHLKITPHKPTSASHGERLLNKSGVGLVKFSQAGQPTNIYHIAKDAQSVEFEAEDTASKWE